ncbi:hypothetical protein [Kitasatospora sp. NPDC002965]|uniref:hypothetical protein n=1 Tax=Kitasatospora sp. NPDC002965 TaxID=3154775 RepID=UPI00339DEF14
MTPRPNAETRRAAREAIEELKKVRDKAHADAEIAKVEADKAMWQAIDALIAQGKVLQSDAATATAYSRDHVAKQTARYRGAVTQPTRSAQDGPGDSPAGPDLPDAGADRSTDQLDTTNQEE